MTEEGPPLPELSLARVVALSDALRTTRSRRGKIAQLATLLSAIERAEAAVVVAWLAGVLPQGRIGVGYAAIRDVADTAPATAPSLTVAAVDGAVTELARVQGKGANARRRAQLVALLAQATPPEQSFLLRLLLGELRQGAQEGVMVDGVAQAAGVPAGAVRRAWMLSGDLAHAAQVALLQGEPGLAAFRPELFRPLQPMLAGTAADVEEALAVLGEVVLEDKLDGARIQVHRRDDEVRVYTRQLNDVTAAVPEVVEAALALPVQEVVLDGEALALQPDGRPHPFQVTMRRFGRRLDVEAGRAALPLTPCFFDCLRLDGADLLDRPLTERIAALDGILPPGHPSQVTAPRQIRRLLTADPAQAEAFVARALAEGHEGVIAKDPAAPWSAGSRGKAWLKVKVAHTLDLVVIAAEWGSGRRQGWLSNLHLGALDPDTGGFVMLGKTFKGLTDALLAWQTEQLLAREVGREGHVVHVRPELVVEIAFNDIQDSPRYPAGLALRFARVRGYRPDKSPADADTLATVQAMHRAARAAP